MTAELGKDSCRGESGALKSPKLVGSGGSVFGGNVDSLLKSQIYSIPT